MLTIENSAVIAGLMRMIFWIQSNIGGRDRVVYHEVGLTYPITDLEREYTDSPLPIVLLILNLIALVTICIFWTFLEVGVGFIVACLLPSTRLLDAIWHSAAVRSLQSFTSSISLRSRTSARTQPAESLPPTSMDQYSQAPSSFAFSSAEKPSRLCSDHEIAIETRLDQVAQHISTESSKTL